MAEPAAEASDTAAVVEDRNFSALLDHVPELWSEILKRVPQADRLHRAPLVSRLFSAACRDPMTWPELRVAHPELVLDPIWQRFLRWLAERASGLQSRVLGNSDEWDQDLIELLSPGCEKRISELIALLAASAPQLRSREYRAGLDPSSLELALPAELGRLSQLTSLTLGLGSAAVTTAQVDAMVQTLPSLQHLSLESVWSGALSDGFPVSIATSCSQLRHLEIRNTGAKLGAVPPELGRLTALTRLALAESGVTSLPSSISRLLSLKELDVFHIPEIKLPSGLTACRQLTWLAIGRCEPLEPGLFEMIGESIKPLAKLIGGPIKRTGGWALLTALAEMFLAQLTGLTALQLDCGSWLFHQPLPLELRSFTDLRKLCIRSAALSDLPAGPYVGALESLEFRLCSFSAGLPASLAAATQLRHLELGVWNTGINLDAVDLAVLGSLPALVSLSLDRSIQMEPDIWDERVAELRAARRAQSCAAPLVIHLSG